jgi:uncharacterized protein YegP (UPF0339 family)
MSRRVMGLGSLVVFVALPLLAPGVLRAGGKSTLTFEIFADKDGEYRWRLKQGDEIIGTAGQGYKAKTSAKKGIEGVQKGLVSEKDTFEIYQDKAKAYRWRLKASNGQLVGAANKGYKTKADCEKVVNLIKKEAPKATITEVKK